MVAQSASVDSTLLTASNKCLQTEKNCQTTVTLRSSEENVNAPSIDTYSEVHSWSVKLLRQKWLADYC